MKYLYYILKRKKKHTLRVTLVHYCLMKILQLNWLSESEHSFKNRLMFCAMRRLAFILIETRLKCVCQWLKVKWMLFLQFCISLLRQTENKKNDLIYYNIINFTNSLRENESTERTNANHLSNQWIIIE